MRKIREGAESEVVDYCFCVFPSLLVLPEPYPHPLLLYFEKDLQILARYDSLTVRQLRSHRIDFGCPAAPQIFRMKSQKVMEYSWSLYFRRSSNQGQSQQYLASQKINLKTAWEGFRGDRQNMRTLSVEFQKNGMGLDFVFVVGLQEKVIAEHMQAFFKQRTPPITIYSDFSPSIAVSRARPSEMASSGSNKNMIQSKMGLDRSDLQDDTMRSETNVQPTLYPGESIIDRIPGASIILEFHQSPERGRQKNEELESTIPLVGSNSQITLNPQLVPDAKSDISKEIQNKIHSSKDIKQLAAPSSHDKPHGRGKLSSEYIRITSSQFIDSQGRIVIVPFYKQSKYLVIIALVILSFVVLMKMGPSFDHLPINEIKSVERKARKAAKTKI